MDTFTIIMAVVLELCGFVAIGHLWTRKSKKSFVGRCLWSVLLLVPILGPLLYGYLQIEPDENPESAADGASGWWGGWRW